MTPDPKITDAELSAAELLRIGSTVTWCHSSSNGRSIGFSTRRGKIIDINAGNGMACVKYRGKLVWLPLRRFRSASARTELTEMVAGPERAHSVVTAEPTQQEGRG